MTSPVLRTRTRSYKDLHYYERAAGGARAAALPESIKPAKFRPAVGQGARATHLPLQLGLHLPLQLLGLQLGLQLLGLQRGLTAWLTAWAHSLAYSCLAYSVGAQSGRRCSGI